MRTLLTFLSCFLMSASLVCAEAHALDPLGPLPERMMNVVPWGDDDEKRTITVNTIYLTDGWTPENYRERLAAHGIDTLRIMWQTQMLDDGAKSRYFADIEALSKAGFKLVISCHTHGKDWGGRFSHYDSKREGDLLIKDRSRQAAPTWNRFIDDWTLIATRFKDDPNVLGYEIFNEYAPTGNTTGPGKLFLRDFGGWMDALAPLTTGAGKGVWVMGPWATTTFSVLENHKDDAGRSMADHFAAHRGKLFPAVHVYNWYGPGFRRPENIDAVKAHLANEKTPAHIRPRLQAIIDEPDAVKQNLMLHQFNFDMRWESTERLIDDARRVCGIGPDTQVWMSEVGTGVMAWSGDAKADSTVASQYRAMMRVCSAKNVSIAFWVDRGKREGWGFFSRMYDDADDARRVEYRQAFFNRATEKLDFVNSPAELSEMKMTW